MPIVRERPSPDAAFGHEPEPEHVPRWSRRKSWWFLIVSSLLLWGLVYFALAAFVSFLGADEAQSQTMQSPCRSVDEMTNFLRSPRYREEPVGFGVQSSGHLVQVWASEDSGTWTIIRVAPDTGLACVIAAGRGWWHDLPPVSTDQPL